jgi:hypothetical protein
MKKEIPLFKVFMSEESIKRTEKTLRRDLLGKDQKLKNLKT